MRKLTLLTLIITLSSPVFAESCLPLYEKKAESIQEKDGYSTSVGGQIVVQNGQLGYWPGIKVPAKIDNWARDLVDAIKWGPYIYSFSSEDPRKDWLEGFRKAIKKDCKLDENNYDKLRAMLTELMEDGSFCPEGKILGYKLFNGKKPYKKILQKAVKDNRFSQYCLDKSIVDDSFREVKNVDESKESKKKKSSASQQ